MNKDTYHGLGQLQRRMLKFCNRHSGWHSITHTDNGATKRVALSLCSRGMINMIGIVGSSHTYMIAVNSLKTV